MLAGAPDWGPISSMVPISTSPLHPLWALLPAAPPQSSKQQPPSLSPSPSRHTTSVRPQNRIKEQATGMREKRGPSSPLPPSQVTTHTPDGDAAAAEVCIKAQKISRSRLSSPPHPRCAVCVPSPRDCEQVLSSSVHPCPVLLVALLD
jgi:hypothetical protein